MVWSTLAVLLGGNGRQYDVRNDVSPAFFVNRAKIDDGRRPTNPVKRLIKHRASCGGPEGGRQDPRNEDVVIERDG